MVDAIARGTQQWFDFGGLARATGGNETLQRAAVAAVRRANWTTKSFDRWRSPTASPDKPITLNSSACCGAYGAVLLRSDPVLVGCGWRREPPVTTGQQNLLCAGLPAGSLQVADRSLRYSQRSPCGGRCGHGRATASASGTEPLLGPLPFRRPRRYRPEGTDRRRCGTQPSYARSTPFCRPSPLPVEK